MEENRRRVVCGFNTLIFVPHFCRFLNFLKAGKDNINDDDDPINDDDDEVGHNFATVCIAWVAAWALAEYMNATMIMITMSMTITMTMMVRRRIRRMIVMMMIKF